MRIEPGLKSCTDVRKNACPRAPGVEPTTGTTAAGSVDGGGWVTFPVARAERVALGKRLPCDAVTLKVTSEANPIRPCAAPGVWPTGLPQVVNRVMPIRSPACTATGGERKTKDVSDPTSNGPRSARKTNDPLGLGRKNLIFAAAGQGVADQVKEASVRLPEALAGFDRSINVTGVWLKPKFGLPGRFPTLTVCATATEAVKRVETSPKAIERRRIGFPPGSAARTVRATPAEGAISMHSGSVPPRGHSRVRNGGDRSIP